jgi:hypothetical protein
MATKWSQAIIVSRKLSIPIKNNEKISLSNTVHIRDTFVLYLDVQLHLRHCGGGETDINKGQAGEEEVHGGVQVGVSEGDQDNE